MDFSRCFFQLSSNLLHSYFIQSIFYGWVMRLSLISWHQKQDCSNCLTSSHFILVELCLQGELLKQDWWVTESMLGIWVNTVQCPSGGSHCTPLHLPLGASQVAQRVKNLPAVEEMQRLGFDPWVGKISWRRAWQPTPVFLPGESHGQWSLAGYSPWVAKSQT